MEMLPCGKCGNLVLVSELKYWLADQTVVFCGAECSLKYHKEKRLINERTVDREI
jgi:hypothetical protein